MAAAAGGVVAYGIVAYDGARACDGTLARARAYDGTLAGTHALPGDSCDGVSGTCTAFRNRLRCRRTDWPTEWA